MTDIVERLLEPVDYLPREVRQEAAAEIERLRGEVSWPFLEETELQLRAEIERLQELLRGTGANRYWEGRWRDEKADNERLQHRIRALEGMLGERMRAALEPKP